MEDALLPKTALQRLGFIVILGLYLTLSALFAWRTPAWQAPDEPAHYNYIAQAASGTLLPIIAEGDWDQAYLNALTSSGFDESLLDKLDSVRYENHQPPLYYWLATPLFLLSDGNLLVLRLYSALLGALTVVLSYGIAREIWPHESVRALAVMALVAFIPQQLHILSSVNNDALAGVVIAALLWFSLRYLKGYHAGRTGVFGVLLGLAVVTKTTTYFMAAPVLIVLLTRWSLDKGGWHDLFHRLRAVALPAGAVALLYWGRNIWVYGFPDFLGLGAHDAIVVGQPRTADAIAVQGWLPYFQEGVRTTFNSFWGQFGWMAAPMNGALPGIYIVLLLVVGLAASGLLILLLSPQRRAKPSEANAPDIQRAIWAVLGLAMSLALLQFLYYNSTFVQFQGRYIFAAIIPFALFLTLGVEVWRQMLSWQVLRWLPVALWLLLAVLDLYLIWRVIPGALA